MESRIQELKNSGSRGIGSGMSLVRFHRVVMMLLGPRFAIRLQLLFFLACLSIPLNLSAGEPDLGTEKQQTQGKKLYEKYCSQCHGEEGDGKGVAARVFDPAPRDFTAGQFKIRTTETGELPDHQDLKSIIIRGMPYTGMPAWPELKDQEVNDLVYYIKTFNEDFSDEEMIMDPLPMPKPPPFSQDSAKKGRKVYEDNKCMDCHGKLGRGDGESAPTLTDDWDQAIRPADLTLPWTFRGGSKREDIYRTFTTGMNGTPMPSYADSIEPEQRWQLVDYIYSLSKGKEEAHSSVITAKRADLPLETKDLKKLEAQFQLAPPAFFPIVGQVMEPGREFFPGAKQVAARALYTDEAVAIFLRWHDMSQEISAKNHPDISIPRFNPNSEPDEEEEDSKQFNDAVAIQIPYKSISGFTRPYFIFGDPEHPVELWFKDLGQKGVQILKGQGSSRLSSDQRSKVSVISNYQNGEWTVVFKTPRSKKDSRGFQEGGFLPIAFSIWDGAKDERGNKRGLTAWYNLYLEPPYVDSVIWPVINRALWVLIFQLVLVFWVRWSHKGRS